MDIIYIGKHNKMFTVEQHHHMYGEIVYCIGGAGSFTDLFGRVIHYKKGDAVIVPPGVLHSNISGEGFSNFFIAVSSLERLPTEISLVQDNERKDLMHCIEQAHFYFNCKEENFKAVLCSLADLIYNYLILLSGMHTFSHYTELILQNIVSNFSEENYRPSEFIKALPFNSEYLCKKFAHETSRSPAQQLTYMRIIHAKKMLKQQATYNLTVKEIASACGFSDALYFSRVFKSATGKSPSQYALFDSE